MLKVVVSKADDVGCFRAVPDVSLEITATLPPNCWASTGEWVAFCEEEAKRIEQTLILSLPGGVYDRLLAAMLNRKASFMRVTHYVPTENLPRPANG